MGGNSQKSLTRLTVMRNIYQTSQYQIMWYGNILEGKGFFVKNLEGNGVPWIVEPFNQDTIGTKEIVNQDI